MVMNIEAAKALPNAVDKLTMEYEAAGKPYYRVEREYYSTGSVRFLIDGTAYTPGGGGYQRYIVKAAAGQAAALFSYKAGDPGGAANLFTTAGSVPLVTDQSHTNQVVGYQTNGEDFAMMGVAGQIKGVRLQMTPGADFPTGQVTAAFKAGVTIGNLYLNDVSNDFLPPEVTSPLILEDNFGRALMKVLDLRELWNQREGDQVALGRALGPGGGESYLHGLGQPTTHNIKRLSKGLIWRNSGTPGAQDTQFSLNCTLREDVYAKVTWPGTTVFGDTFGPLVELDVDYQIIMHGVAFYLPSENR